MRIVIFAAGQGTRFGELTRSRPKHLIPIFGKPFLEYLLDRVKAAGFFGKDIIVVTGFCAEQTDQFLRTYDPEIQTVNQWKLFGDKMLGTAMPLRAAGTVFKDDCVALAGDNLYDPQDIAALARPHDLYYHVSALSVPDPGAYGTVEVYDGMVRKIREKDTSVTGPALVNASLYRLKPDIFHYVETVNKSPRGEYELVDALNSIAGESRVKLYEMKGYWVDFGKPSDIKTVEQFLKNQK